MLVPTERRSMRRLRHLWERWKRIAHTIGVWPSRGWLTVFSYGRLAPFGLRVRLWSDPLGITPRPGPHWRRKEHAAAASSDRARRQY
jgi:hypothetical protein